MTLRDIPKGPWTPTAENPLRGCADGTRRLYAVILEEPGIAKAEAGRRAGIVPDGPVSTLISRDLIREIPSMPTARGTYILQLWPLEQRA